MTPKEILDSTTPEVRKLIEEILKVEKKYQHVQNLAIDRTSDALIAEEMIKIIHQEIR